MTPLHYVFPLVFMLLFDAAWIGANRAMYTNAVKSVQEGQAMQLNIAATVLVYGVLYAAMVGVCLPAVVTADVKGVSGSKFVLETAKKSALKAGALGLIVYGVYNLTTKAILHKYPWKVCALDTAWGGAMFTAVAFCTATLTRVISN